MDNSMSPRRVRLILVLSFVALMVFFSLVSLRIGRALAADPTPQGVSGVTQVVLMQYSNVTNTTSGGNSVALITGGYGMADCYNNGTFQGGIANSVTTTIQSSSDGSNWVDTQPMVIITNGAVMSRVVLYGYYTRVSFAAVLTTANPITGSVVCALKNLK